jgi:restriction system protein
LAARYDARFSIDPWKFEEVVASVYRDQGYRTRVTARSGDGGVDIMLDGPDNSTIGVQVKRYRGKVKVDHIRALVGALVDADPELTRGIFVATSEFQPGAQKYVTRQRLRGRRIELVDAAAFYDALGIAQRKQYNSLADRSAPFSAARMISLYSHEFRHGVP